MLRTFVSIRMTLNSNHYLKSAILIRSVLWGNTTYRPGPVLLHWEEAVIRDKVLDFQSVARKKTACNPIFSLEI